MTDRPPLEDVLARSSEVDDVATRALEIAADWATRTDDEDALIEMAEGARRQAEAMSYEAGLMAFAAVVAWSTDPEPRGRRRWP